MTKRILACGIAAGLLATLTACGNKQAPSASRPSFYVSLASASETVDAPMARDMISAYRRNHGLGPLVLDPVLQEKAALEVRAMARSGKPGSADAVKQRLAQEGIDRTEINVSAGYHTLAEAFSGWRDSPQHNRVMLAQNAKRIGIATAYEPSSKYKVYWVLIEAP